MYDIELKIKPSDWLYILFTGVLFSSLLSLLGYLILSYGWLDGIVFGALLGFSITLFSLIFITFMNQKILPRVSKLLWLPMAVFFSFSSGFLGTLLTTFIAQEFEIKMIPLLQTHQLIISATIGLLTYMVGAILYRFVNMRNKKEEIDRYYLQSRLGSLETQLNSHFLFNALNSVAELVHSDPNKAESAILKISTFLRNTMDEKPLIPLEDELRNIQDYVTLENIRFGGKIKLFIDETDGSFMLPKFSLQLIVENAIKHGMYPDKGLEIHLNIESKNKTIIVHNNGKPMNTKKFSTGLSNLNERLAILCNGSLEITQTQRPTFLLQIGECHENTHC
ncbi:MAG: hypothetical protein RLZZ428_1038 [Pseudomonadota bacterium]|jgi:sensor histidine kinase YesM